MIEKILKDPWQPSVEEGREVPQFQDEVNCVVRFPLLSVVCDAEVDPDLAFCRSATAGSLETSPIPKPSSGLG